MTEPWRLTATELVRRRHAGQLGAVEVVAATLARLRETAASLNAVVHIDEAGAREQAQRFDAMPRAMLPPLAGLPILVHDLLHVAGMPTRFGSVAFADDPPMTGDDPAVLALREAGAIILGKANVPAFGAGAACVNDLHGATRNPWDLGRTPGGSGGAAAVAAGAAFGTTGGDLAGSLRVPASFSGLAGLRPSAGRVPRRSGPLAFDDLNVIGPLARCVADAALLLDAMSVACGSDPLALGPPATPFLAEAEAPRMPSSIGVSHALGLAPVDDEVAACVDAAMARFASAGARVAAATIDLAEAPGVFAVKRALWFSIAMRPVVEERGAQLPPSVTENLERAERLSLAEVAAAEAGRARLYAAMMRGLAEHGVIASAATIVPALPLGQARVTEAQGTRFEGGAVDWLRPTTAVTLLGCPSLVLPCGFTSGGLPVGLQLIAPPRQEALLLRTGAWLERALGLADRLPIDPRGAA
ncbi:amidase [Elioraea sp.]|uniref:amidase n=1 Tax=Elioraea sp. TaxID=2185103 RepID=UPI0025C5520E|nr:amidase [Elioraea sp.]